MEVIERNDCFTIVNAQNGRNLITVMALIVSPECNNHGCIIRRGEERIIVHLDILKMWRRNAFRIGPESHSYR